MVIEQVQCAEKNCRKLIIKNSSQHIRCSDCSSKRRRKVNAAASRKAYHVDPIEKRCRICSKIFKTKDKNRTVCGDCRHASPNSGELPHVETRSIHMGNGPRLPAEKVWEQAMRVCR